MNSYLIFVYRFSLRINNILRKNPKHIRNEVRQEQAIDRGIFVYAVRVLVEAVEVIVEG
jgi:hypothetical protein